MNRQQPPRRLSFRIGMLLLFAQMTLTLTGPILSPFNPLAIDVSSARQPPNSRHWLGTDHLGRDLLTRILYGGRLSTIVGLGIVIPAAVVGAGLGSIAGFFAGPWDIVLMRITDALMAFPLLILAMAMSVALGRGTMNAMLAIILTFWPIYARLIRSQAALIRDCEFVVASRALGMNEWSILWRHIIPNSLDILIAQAASDVGIALVVMASLSFLGLGVPAPTPEWGTMILEGRTYLRESWWISTFPGMCLFTLVFTFSLIADGLGDRKP